MPVVVTGLSHHSAPVELRERFAFTEMQILEALDRLCGSGMVEEAVILSTCNRVEIYAAAQANDPEFGSRLREFFCEFHGLDEMPGEGIYTYHESRSIEHLFRVACGLDSMVLGETEVLGQLKDAYRVALGKKATGPRLNRTFQKAFNVAKLVRSETQIQCGSISVSSVAVELAETIFESLKSQQVLVIGAGDTSEKAARALKSRGAKSILVSNRSPEKSEVLADELGGRAIRFDAWEEEFTRVEIVISSTSAPHYILNREKLENLLRRRGHRPLLLIDIAVPRDIDPDANLLENVYLYNIDDLQAIAGEHLKQRQDELALCEKIIREKRLELEASLHLNPDRSKLELRQQEAGS